MQKENLLTFFFELFAIKWFRYHRSLIQGTKYLLRGDPSFYHSAHSATPFFRHKRTIQEYGSSEKVEKHTREPGKICASTSCNLQNCRMSQLVPYMQTTGNAYFGISFWTLAHECNSCPFIDILQSLTMKSTWRFHMKSIIY